jgi:hypothetical protein
MEINVYRLEMNWCGLGMNWLALDVNLHALEILSDHLEMHLHKLEMNWLHLEIVMYRLEKVVLNFCSVSLQFEYSGKMHPNHIPHLSFWAPACIDCTLTVVCGQEAKNPHANEVLLRLLQAAAFESYTLLSFRVMRQSASFRLRI